MYIPCFHYQATLLWHGFCQVKAYGINTIIIAGIQTSQFSISSVNLLVIFDLGWIKNSTPHLCVCLSFVCFDREFLDLKVFSQKLHGMKMPSK